MFYHKKEHDSWDKLMKYYLSVLIYERNCYVRIILIFSLYKVFIWVLATQNNLKKKHAMLTI